MYEIWNTDREPIALEFNDDEATTIAFALRKYRSGVEIQGFFGSIEGSIDEIELQHDLDMITELVNKIDDGERRAQGGSEAHAVIESLSFVRNMHEGAFAEGMRVYREMSSDLPSPATLVLNGMLARRILEEAQVRFEE